MPKLDEIESLFFQVLEDIREFLGDLTLVGGWLPYIYTKYLWKEVHAKPVTTVDIDFGFGEIGNKIYSKTVFELLSSLAYEERHISIGKLYPIVFYKKNKIPIDFIASPKIPNDVIDKFIGRQIYVNRIEGFDFLLKHRIRIDVKVKKLKAGCTINCPKPSAFLYHKGAVFIDRETEQDKAKDLQYMYFVLRNAPDTSTLLEEVAQYKEKGYFRKFPENLNKYFAKTSSMGCLMVEKENGPDDYIDNLRKDIFERFKTLRELF